MQPRFLLVDDHALIRKGLVQLLSDVYPGSAFAEAADSEAALAKVRSHRFDAVVLDLSLGDADGLEVLEGIRRHRPQLPVIIFSMHNEPQIALRALRAGALGFVTKASMPTAITTAVENVLAGNVYTSPEIATKLAADLSGISEELPHEKLSRRELQVFKLAGQAQTARQIADALNVSEKTVGTYRARIAAKTGLKTYAEIVKYCLSYKL